MTWHYQNKPYTQAPEEYVGFVYEIHDLMNNRKYIGKKNFWKTVKLKPLKGKTNKRHRRLESDWQEYYGSSSSLQEMVATLGPDHFHREILYLCANKTQMSYWETRTQFDRDVLFDDTYYNEFISCRINSRGLK